MEIKEFEDDKDQESDNKINEVKEEESKEEISVQPKEKEALK